MQDNGRFSLGEKGGDEKSSGFMVKQLRSCFILKIKYYNIRISEKNEGYFGFPSGELPEWAPKMDKITQWKKTVIDPINRFLEVMDIPKVNASSAIQLSLF